MKHFIYIFPLMLLLSHCRPNEKPVITQFPGKPVVPSSIKAEHSFLLGQLYKITLYKDSTGSAAVKLNELMQHHFKEEEDFVLPPLGLLPSLSKGILPEHAKEVIALTEKLKSQLTHMSVEHQLIVAYIEELRQADYHMLHQTEIDEFEKEVKKHATTEEEVFFPAAILVGDYLKLKSMPQH